MDKWNIYFLTTIILSVLLLQCNAGQDSYVAAVMGVRGEKFLVRPEFAFYFNIEHYATLVNYLMSNAPKKPDIIVFPEEGLQGDNEPYPIQIPPIEDFVVPCTLGDKVNMGLRALSCLAREKRVYLVVNLVESHYNISSNKSVRFNTNVAFNRLGAVVARYRKSNLNEQGIDVPSKPDISYFETDFGVTFGLFTGSDIFFKEPMNTLLTKHKISHFAHPARLYNELPFFTAIQVQSSWAFAKYSVLLSAGYNDPENGNSGAGIYQGIYGASEYSQPESGKAFALITEVPKDVTIPKNLKTGAALPTLNVNTTTMKTNILQLEKVMNQPSLLMEMSIDAMEEKIWNRHSPVKQKAMKNVFLYSVLKLNRDNVESYSTKLIEPTIDQIQSTPELTVIKPNMTITASSKINEKICTNKNKFCCNFQVEVTSTYLLQSKSIPYANIISGDNFTNYYYRLAVFDGAKNFSDGGNSLNNKLQICGIIPCLNKAVNSCALRTDIYDEGEPKYAPPATIEKYNHTFIQIGTTFNVIKISTEIKGNDSDVFPNILTKGRKTDEFGGLPDTATFDFDTKVLNKTISANFQVAGPIKNLGSISILARINDSKSSSTIIKLSNVFLLLPLFYVYYLIH